MTPFERTEFASLVALVGCLTGMAILLFFHDLFTASDFLPFAFVGAGLSGWVHSEGFGRGTLRMVLAAVSMTLLGAEFGSAALQIFSGECVPMRNMGVFGSALGAVSPIAGQIACVPMPGLGLLLLSLAMSEPYVLMLWVLAMICLQAFATRVRSQTG